MASFFISHSSRDEESSLRVADRLKAEGYESVFLDFDPTDGIPAGRDWERELYAQLRRADALVFLCSASALESRWCFAELALARAMGKPIFPVALEPGARHPLLEDTQGVEWIGLGGDGEVAFERLWSGFRKHGFDPADAFAWDPSRPPFPGLSALEAEDAAVFFGRDPEIKELLGRLQPILASSRRLIALIGPSGSGKSSLVRAGLVPGLQKLGGRWAVVPALKPGTRPLSTLARRLATALGHDDWREIRERIARDPAQLIDVTEDLLERTGERASSALLVVDQAEELVTSDPEERALFLASLGAALRQATALWVVATIRSEYVTAVLQEPGLADVIGPAAVVGLLDRSRIPEVIAKPAHRAGLELDPGLVARMVEDTGSGDALPLLAYTLQQLYERAGPEGRITLEDYDEIGGVLGALRGRADSIAEELERAGRGELVVPTLVRFANVEQGTEPIGRRVLRRHLSATEDDVVQAFVEARLLTSDGAGDDATIGVAHDSLLRSWGPLRQAIDVARDDLRLRSELERLAQDWDSVGRSHAYLLREERLDRASAFLESELGGEALPLVQEFVDRSRAQSQAVMRRESDLLAGRIHETLDEDPERGILLALAAIEQYAASPRAIRALHAADAAWKLRLSMPGHEAEVATVGFSPDGAQVLTACSDGTARVWDAASGEELQYTRGPEGEVRSVAFSPEGGRIVTVFRDGPTRVWDAATGEELQQLPRGDEEDVSGAAFSPDGERIVTVSFETARVWDAATGRQLQQLRGSRIVDSALAPGGERVVIASAFGTARVCDTYSGEELQQLRGHDFKINGAAFSPGGERVVTASWDGTARVWDAASGEELQQLRHSRDAGASIFEAAFSPDGGRVVTASVDGARVWDAASGEELQQLRVHEGGVLRAAFSPEGGRVVTGSEDGTVRVWDVAGGGRVTRRGRLESEGFSKVERAWFSPDARRVMTTSKDRTARVWDMASGEELQLRGHENGVVGAAFSRDGRRIVTSSWEDATTRIWDATTGEQLLQLGEVQRIDLSVAFSPDGERVVTAGDGIVWDATTGEQLRQLRGHEDAVGSAAFSPDGRRIVTASSDGTARVWDVTTGEELLQLRGHGRRVLSAAFSPDGGRVVTGSVDDTVRVWNATTGEELQQLHDGSGAEFSPDGQRLLGIADDGTARVWDAASGEPLQQLGDTFIMTIHETSPADAIKCATFSPNGTQAVTVSESGTVRVWETLPLDLLVTKAKARVSRRLTDAERAEFGLPADSPA